MRAQASIGEEEERETEVGEETVSFRAERGGFCFSFRNRWVFRREWAVGV